MRHVLRWLPKVRGHGKSRVLFIVLMVGAALSAAGGGYLAARSAGHLDGRPDKEQQGPGQGGRFQNHRFIKFGTAIVNLAEGRLTRYLKVTIILEVSRANAKKVKKVVDGNTKAVLKDWLISYLSDLKLQDVKGSQSLFRIRTRIKEGFNKLLRKHKSASVEKVLFKEFSIQ